MHRMPEWRSRSDRKAVCISGLVRLASGLALPVTLVDASDGGCKIACLHSLPIGEIVQLEIADCQPSIASVRWSLPGRAGLRFLSPNMA
jgi:hypothetical protein